MSGAEGTPGRRLRLVPARRDATPAEPPRVEALDALLRQVDDLRLTLSTDLSLAASAVEAGSPEIAAEILGADQDALHRFEIRALDHLAELETPAARKQSVWAQVHVAPIVAAAALVGLLAGLAPQALGPRNGSQLNVAATDSLQRLQQLAENGDADQVRAASVQLHAQLADVVANAKTDPMAAQTALLLLTYEQSAIVHSSDSGALADVLRQSQALARAIVAAMPAQSRPVATAVPVPAAPKPSPSTKTAAKPASSPSPSPATKPSASPKPAPSASPSPSQGSSGYPLPSTPVAP